MDESKCENSSSEVLAKLKGFPVFAPFEEKYLDGLLKESRLRFYAPKELIIREDEIDNWIYFIITGKVLVSKGGVELCTLSGEGQVFGEMAIIEAKPRSASVFALDKTECLAIDASYIDRIDEDEKIVFMYVLYRIFAELLADRLRMTTAELVRSRKMLSPLLGV